MTISSALKRGVENTTVHTLLRICEGLDITIDELFRRRALDTIFYKISNLPLDKYTDDDILADLIESKLINLKKQHYTDEQLKSLVNNYRFYCSDWLGSPPEDLSTTEKK